MVDNSKLTFWQGRLGRFLAPLLGRSIICGQSCGCNGHTGCLSGKASVRQPFWVGWKRRDVERDGWGWLKRRDS